MTAPLAGVTVVEMATFITGPYTSMLLGDMGANVIKLEHPDGGDPFRRWTGPGLSPRFVAFNRGKRSVALDLGDPVARQAAHRLLATADVFVENFRPGVTARLGVDYATLRELNPEIVHVSITGRGEDGPDAARPTYDGVGQAISGLMSLYTDPKDPEVLGPAMSDALTGLSAAYGAVAALHARDRDGVGQHVTTSMLQATLGFLVEPVSHFAATGEVPGPRTRGHQSQSYAFPTADGKALVVHLSTPQKFWERFVTAIGRTDLLEDPGLATYGDRVAAYERIRTELAPTFSAEVRAVWLERLQDADVPCAPVNGIDEVLDDPQVRHLGLETAIPTGDGGTQRATAPPVTLADLPDPGAVPTLGEHTATVLAAAGVDPATVVALTTDPVPA